MKALWQAIGTLLYYVSWPVVQPVVAMRRRTRVLVVAEGRVLLLRGWISSGRWDMPGGGLHLGEDVVAGAIREVREETGLRLPPSRLRPIGEVSIAKPGFRARYSCFVAELPAHQPLKKRPLEITDIAWRNPADCTESELTPQAWQLLQAWLQS